MGLKTNIFCLLILVATATSQWGEDPSYYWSSRSRCSPCTSRPPCTPSSTCQPTVTLVESPTACAPCPEVRCPTPKCPEINCPTRITSDDVCPLTFIKNGTDCVCPENTPYHDITFGICLECDGGRLWNELTEECVCPADGPQWNDVLRECVCPLTTEWNRSTKKCECLGDQIFDSSSRTCHCRGDMIFDSSTKKCTCGNEMVFSSRGKCECPRERPRFDYTSEKCVACEQGQIWREDFGDCGCLGDQNWNPVRKMCQCPANKIWDPYLKICKCGAPESDECENKIICDPAGVVFPECPVGYKLSYNNMCYKETNAYCESGMRNGEFCVDTKISNTICPPGYIFDDRFRKCAYLVEPSCASGQTFRDGKCIEEIKVAAKCQIGYEMIHSKCVQFEIPSCPYGYEKHQGKCIKKRSCKEGEEMINGVCISKVCPIGYILKCGVCQLPVKLDCPEGFYFDGSVCRIKIVTCPRGFIIERNVCRRIVEPCPRGYIEVGHECRRKITGCPAGYSLIGDVCRRINVHQREDCHPGYLLINGKCVKVSSPISTCQPDEIEVNGVCVKKSKCKPDEIERDDICVKVLKCAPGETVYNGKCYKIVPPKTDPCPNCPDCANCGAPCSRPECRTGCNNGKCSSNGGSSGCNNGKCITNEGSSGGENSPATHIYSNLPSPYTVHNVNNVNVYGGGSEAGGGCSYKCDNNQYRNNCHYVCQ